MSILSVKNLSVTVGHTPLVSHASLTLKPRQLSVILGPNGAGKTSVLRAAMGLIPSQSERLHIGDTPLHTLSARERARHISYLPQTRPLAWPARVKDVVALGRFAHGATLGSLKDSDEQAVQAALAACDLSALSDRQADTLSGGETARMHCARAFAAKAPLLIADEPVAALDPRHQFKVMALIRRFVDDGGGALIVLHDLSLAARYADHIIWMKTGCVTDQGLVPEMMTSAKIADVFGVNARIEGAHILLDDAPASIVQPDMTQNVSS